MQKSIAVFLLATFAPFALSATQLMAGVIPPIGLVPGSQYQLIFVTADTRDATSSNIADYNAFVSAEAALNPSLPSGVTWMPSQTRPVPSSMSTPRPAGCPFITHKVSKLRRLSQDCMLTRFSTQSNTINSGPSNTQTCGLVSPAPVNRGAPASTAPWGHLLSPTGTPTPRLPHGPSSDLGPTRPPPYLFTPSALL